MKFRTFFECSMQKNVRGNCKEYLHIVQAYIQPSNIGFELIIQLNQLIKLISTLSICFKFSIQNIEIISAMQDLSMICQSTDNFTQYLFSLHSYLNKLQNDASGEEKLVSLLREDPVAKRSDFQ